MRHALVPAIVLAALACAAAPLPEPRSVPAVPPRAGNPGLDEILAADLAADRAFPWSAARRLSWSDFQGTPPGGGPAGAMTAYTIYYAWKCRGDEFEFRTVAGFRPRESWVKPVILEDPVQRRSALVHEQTHFDLSELHARRMRQNFDRLEAPCRRADGDLDARARRFIDEEKADQRRYDAETGNGVRDEPQSAWTADVARRLAALGSHAR